MLEEKFNAIFSRRLRFYLNKYDITQVELAKRLNVGTTSVYNWCNGIKTPRMDKVDAMCEIFHCNRSDLMEDKTTSDKETTTEPYYQDADARDLAQFMYENPEYKVLFDASRKVKKEDIEFVKQMIDRVRGDNNDTGC